MRYGYLLPWAGGTVFPASVHIWKLSEGGGRAFGLSCTEDGRYALRPRADLERLLGRAFGNGISLDRLMPGFRVVACALDERNLCLAQIAAVQLRVPDLPDLLARRSMEAEDLLIKRARDDERLARNGWDPAEHPRAGVPPNRGWFADKPTQIVQGEEDERAPEEMLDPLAPVRQAQWDARIATLLQIEPGNPNLTYFANPGSAPSQAALDRLDAVINEAETRRVMDKVMPDGTPIGQKGNDPSVREHPGGILAAKDLFDYLRMGGRTQLENDKITVIQLPGNASYVTFRPVSDSGPPAVDINVSGVTFDKIHFP
jgi:hypothetical protein